jgi:predicted transcriptional regulator
MTSLTPEEYRSKWGLKPDYPMVAPSYARKQQALAKQMGWDVSRAAPRRLRSRRPSGPALERPLCRAS